MLVRDLTEGPVSRVLNARNCFNGVEEVIILGRVLDVSINEERVSFGVDILHNYLETIKVACLSHLYFIGETLIEVLIDNIIGWCKECKNMLNKVTFIVEAIKDSFFSSINFDDEENPWVPLESHTTA